MKNIIFDWSGVVRDSLTSQLWIVNQMFEMNGVDQITVEELRENWEQPHFNFYKKYLPESFVLEDEERVFRELVQDVNCPQPVPFEGMLDLILKLKAKGYFLAIVSSDLSETLYKEIKDWKLEGVFDVIVVESVDKSVDVGKIIEVNNLSTKDTFFIGDSNHEIEASHKWGIRSVAVTWGFTSESKLKLNNPDYLVGSIKELDDVLF